MLLRVALQLGFAFAFAAAQGPESPRPPGQMVDIGDYSLHIKCLGTGSPTVILMHGLSGFSFDWSLVQPEVARFTRVCAYDRAGQAWSDPGPAPRGIRRITEELNTLLERAHIDSPYVLVGHSWGGLIPRVYLDKYPQKVRGIVFVDSSNEDMDLWVNGKTVWPRLTSPADWKELIAPKQRPAGAPPPGSPVVMRRSGGGRIEPPFERLPAEAQSFRIWARNKPRDATIAAGGDWGDVRTDLKLVAALNDEREYPLGDLPVVAIAGTRYEYTQDDVDAGFSEQEKLCNHLRLNYNLAHYSTRGKAVIARGSGHYIHVERPDLVISAIRDVYAAGQKDGQSTRGRKKF